jgi:AcrR family transcriptional regulator
VAEEILERDGLQALTLRAAARAAGVSHAAPAHHFGDLTGLLSELAAEGYRRFSDTLMIGMEEAGTDPRERMHAMGRAYVRFARTQPNLFILMFRSERLDQKRPALEAAIAGARQVLRGGIAAIADPARPVKPIDAVARATAIWSIVHGFAVLLLDGRLQTIMTSLPEEIGVETLLEAVLANTRVGG